MSGIGSLGSSPVNQPSVDEPEAPAAPAAPAEAGPAPAPAAASATVTTDVGRRSGTFRNLVNRGVSEAEKAISKEILKPHEVDSTFKIVDGAAAGVRLKEQVWLPSAPEVAGDKLKKATSDALAAEGKTIAWGKVEGEVRLASSFTTGAGDATIGFPGGAKLGYTLTKPYAYEGSARGALDTAKDALKSQTWGLPTNAKNARNLPPGAEFQLKGELTLGATAAGGGISSSVKSAGTAQVDVKRGEGESVVVTVTKELQTDTAASLGRPIAGPLSGSIGRTTTGGEKTVESFTLDLSNPRAQATYDALVRGDTGAARAVAAGGAASGVTGATRTDEEWDGRKLAAGLALKLTNGFGAGLSVYGEKISERDPRIASSPMRQRMIAEAKARGQDLEFQGTGGALEAAFATEATAGAVGAGFSTKGIVEYHAVTPGSSKLAPTDLPLDAAKARALKPGTEVTLHGAGSVAVSAKAGYGVSATAGPVTAGASIGVTGEVRASKDLGLDIVKLEGDKVRVVIADRDTKTGTTTLSAEAGIKDINREQIPGGSALEGIVGDKLAGEAKKAVAKSLTDLVQAKASLGAAKETSARDVASYDLDLSTDAGRKAYDRLLRLDAREAERLAADPASGVKKNGSLEEKISTDRTTADVKILGQDIYSSKAERRDRVAVLVNAAGTTRISESEYRKETKGLVRSGDVEWEAVQVKNDATGASQRFLHLTVGKLEDKWTSVGDWQRSERFATMMGAKVVEREVKDENPSWWDRNINPAAKGKTTASADVYFTDEAMKKIAAADDEKALAAFGLSTMKLAGETAMPGWAAGPAQMKKAARELLEAYDPFESSRNQDIRSQYYRLTKRDIGKDYETWEDAKDFQKFVQRSRAGGEQERLKAFADLGKERRFDFHATIGAMNELAGDEVVLLNRFEVRGSDVKLVTASEGALASPDTAVSETFTPQ